MKKRYLPWLIWLLFVLFTINCSENPTEPVPVPKPANLFPIVETFRFIVLGKPHYMGKAEMIVYNNGDEVAEYCRSMWTFLDADKNSGAYITFSGVVEPIDQLTGFGRVEPQEMGIARTANYTRELHWMGFPKEIPPWYVGVILYPGGEGILMDIKDMVMDKMYDDYISEKPVEDDWYIYEARDGKVYNRKTGEIVKYEGR